MVVNREDSEMQKSHDRKFRLLVLEQKKKRPDIKTAKQLADAMEFRYDSTFLENLRRVGLG